MHLKIILIALLSFLLVGCENNTTSKNSSSSNEYSRLSNNYESPLLNNSKSYNNNSITSGDDNLASNNTDENYVEEIKKEIYGSKEDLYINNQADNSISTFTTSILTSDPNRYHNITIVRDRLNNYVLSNNQVFSFNEVCGPYGADDGFKEATILLSNGKEDKGFGGGVCQLSTTLYNAVKNLDIEIIERHKHSIPVAYVKKDQDATVSLQSNLDFKFKNVSGKDFTFKCFSTENSLTVKVYAN